MDAHLTAGTETDVGDQDVTVDREAPYGRRPDGTPYKRDPEQMRRIRESRGSGAGISRKAGPAPARPSRPASTAGKPPPKKARSAYGAGVARAVVNGANLMFADPVERAIMRHQGVKLAVIVDRMLDEDPRLLQWIERLRLRMAGGAKGEALAWMAGTGGLLAVHRGYKHPLLAMAFGAALEQIHVEAVAYERQAAIDRAELEAMLAEIQAEESQIQAQYAAQTQVPGPPLASPMAQFADARAP